MTDWVELRNGAKIWAPPKEDNMHRRQFIVALPDGVFKPTSPGELDDICDRLREWLLEHYG